MSHTLILWLTCILFPKRKTSIFYSPIVLFGRNMIRKKRRHDDKASSQILLSSSAVRLFDLAKNRRDCSAASSKQQAAVCSLQLLLEARRLPSLPLLLLPSALFCHPLGKSSASSFLFRPLLNTYKEIK